LANVDTFFARPPTNEPEMVGTISAAMWAILIISYLMDSEKTYAREEIFERILPKNQLNS
jgi:hypothetical protein